MDIEKKITEEILRNITILARIYGVYDEDVWKILKNIVSDHE